MTAHDRPGDDRPGDDSGLARDAVRDVVVLGDGPAGSALADALVRRGVDAVLVGPGAPWGATYGAWVDDVSSVVPTGAGVWQARGLDVLVRFGRTRRLDREYGVLDNVALRATLQDGVDSVPGVVRSVRPADGGAPHRVETEQGATVRGRVLIDATGWPRRFDVVGAPGVSRAASPAPSPAWQTALGVVLPDAPPGAGPMCEPTLMDFAEPDGAPAVGVPTFGYALPVADGWLLEETVLAARPAVAPERLAARLAARVGVPFADLESRARRIEEVRIPMGAPPTAADDPVATFGAAAGLIHPATGYSVGAALRLAPAFADALAALLERPGAVPSSGVIDALWSPSMRRTRALHRFGADVLLGVDGDGVRAFFDAFFDLDRADWSAYLDPATPPGEIAAVMARLFRSAPWSLRRRLLAANPLPLLRALPGRRR